MKNNATQNRYTKTVLSILIGLIPVFCVNAKTVYESNINASPAKGGGGFTPIRGHYPFIERLGIQVVENALLNNSGEPIGIKAGTRLALPIGFGGGDGTSGIPDTPFYSYMDLDKDKDIFTFVTSDQDQTSLEVRWFILDTDKEWSSVGGWQDIERKTEITASQYLFVDKENNPRAVDLIVPPEAVGKRIGATIVPVSETGDPKVGNRMYLWDIQQFFGQRGPGGGQTGDAPESADINPLNPGAGDEGYGDPGKPIEPNLLFPGDGVVQGPIEPADFEVIFKDLLGNEILNNYAVEQDYIAEITLDGKPLTEEMVKKGELNWLLYQPVLGASASCDYNVLSSRHDPNCFVSEVFNELSPNIESRDLARVENIFENGILKHSLLRTQGINSDATQKLKTTEPNKSEQGYWIEIQFSTE